MRRIRYYSFGKVNPKVIVCEKPLTKQDHLEVQKLQDGLAAMKDAVEEWPQTLKALMIWTYVQVAQPILDMSEGRRVAWFIATINGAVYIAWQFPRLKPFMTRHFTHDPLSGLSYTLLTSMFRCDCSIYCTLERMLTSNRCPQPQILVTSVSELNDTVYLWYIFFFVFGCHILSTRSRFRYNPVVRRRNTEGLRKSTRVHIEMAFHRVLHLR